MEMLNYAFYHDQLHLFDLPPYAQENVNKTLRLCWDHSLKNQLKFNMEVTRCTKKRSKTLQQQAFSILKAGFLIRTSCDFFSPHFRLEKNLQRMITGGVDTFKLITNLSLSNSVQRSLKPNFLPKPIQTWREISQIN